MQGKSSKQEDSGALMGRGDPATERRPPAQTRVYLTRMVQLTLLTGSRFLPVGTSADRYARRAGGLSTSHDSFHVHVFGVDSFEILS